MIWEQIKKFAAGLLIGIFLGAYGITHLDEAWHGWQTFRAFAVRTYHHEPKCPDGLICITPAPASK